MIHTLNLNVVSLFSSVSYRVLVTMFMEGIIIRHFRFRLPCLPQCSSIPAGIIRPYPPVEVTRFQGSSGTCLNLMEEGNKLLRKVQNDSSFAHQLKDAAQQNDHTHVHTLIRKAGVNSALQTSYNPDAIQIDLHTGAETDCSELSIKLCW